jgi:hypothetical protein
MTGHFSSSRSRAEHYRALAALISDEATCRILLDMAQELDGDDNARPAPDAEAGPPLRSFS